MISITSAELNYLVFRYLHESGQALISIRFIMLFSGFFSFEKKFMVLIMERLGYTKIAFTATSYSFEN
jgi:hypothetical protein